MTTSDTPLLSIIIPTLNEAHALPLVLGDIALQRGIRLEVIVGDGGSTDATKAAAIAGGARFVPARRGRGAQMNEAARLARGPYLFFLHADSRLHDPHLLADAILLDQGWLPTQQLSVAMLREATGIEAELALVRAFTVTKSIAGWHATWQQPKPVNLAVGMGSVFVFQAAAPLSEADCAKLAELQQQGIGERRQEGYGQIRICDEFHSRETWQKEQEA
ncbi:MAG: glycosyltransferase [Chloroflexia bacterium]|nr:glycosyltransferase [Chloroflexia bacterium]